MKVIGFDDPFFNTLDLSKLPQNPKNGQVFYFDHRQIVGTNDLPVIYSARDNAWMRINSYMPWLWEGSPKIPVNTAINPKSVCVEDIFRNANFRKIFPGVVNFQLQQNVGVCATASAVHTMLVDMARRIVFNKATIFYYPWLTVIYGAARVNIYNKKRLTPIEKGDGSYAINALLACKIWNIPEMVLNTPPRITEDKRMKLFGNEGTPENLLKGRLFVKHIIPVNGVNEIISAINNGMCVTLSNPFCFSGKKPALAIGDNNLKFEQIIGGKQIKIYHEMNIIGYTTNVPNRKLHFVYRDHNAAMNTSTHPDYANRVSRPAGVWLLSVDKLLEVDKSIQGYTCMLSAN